MADLSAIYRNPRIPPGYYFAKVVELDTENIAGYDRPLVFVRVKIDPEHGLGDHVVLANIIHPTEGSKFYYANFVSTFIGFETHDLRLALNRWGSIEVYDAEYQGTKYSAVKWTYQTRQVRSKIEEIYRREQERPVDEPIPV